MKKKIIKNFLKSLSLRLNYIFEILEINIIKSINYFLVIKYAEFGAGRDSNYIGWFSGDYQDGYFIDEKTNLPFSDGQLIFAYSSMFFEHINDLVVLNLLKEVHRSLKKGGVFRIVVPNFWLYCEKYKAGDLDFFLKIVKNDPNLKTWKAQRVTLDIEHYFIYLISAIDNMPLKIVTYPWQENLYKTPPHVIYPFQEKILSYYCGPAPEITTNQIRKKFENLNTEDFLTWVFKKNNSSTHASNGINTWHKNYWNYKKIKTFSEKAGFIRCEKSFYQKIYAPREKEGHKQIALYFNLYKK